mmetsp:Transcript_69020/g.166891  ORF Transcript_69020/g.166891 Transcript_69020/m.166891 type:complete len:217 (+) Transcript_69020:230-880(+)
MRRLLCRLPERPFGVLHQQNWWQPDLCRAVRKVEWQGRACHWAQAAGLLRLPAGRVDVGLLLWCLVRQAGGLRGPLQAESAITAGATCFAAASPGTAGSPYFAPKSRCAAPSGAVALVAALAAQPALAPQSIGGRPGCGSHCRDRYRSRPACRHWRCSYRQDDGKCAQAHQAYRSRTPLRGTDALLCQCVVCGRVTVNQSVCSIVCDHSRVTVACS